ncbi:unnamed protein product, partial [Didymodactylos carnosus]
PSVNGSDYIPVLEWSDPDDWTTYTKADVIVWPSNSLVAPTGNALLSDEFGNSTTKLTGYMPDLIALLQNNTGFTPHTVLVPSNQTYDALVQAVVNGAYDILAGDVTITASRSKIVDFLNSIFDNSLSIIVRRPADVSLDLLGFLKPFSFKLWLKLLAVTVCGGVMICLIERKGNEAFQDRSIIPSGAMNVWYSIGTIMGYGADFQVATSAGRLFTVGLYILSLILVATYTANLASGACFLKKLK